MKQLQLINRIHECEEHGWNDLLLKVDQVTQSLVDTPCAGTQIKTALMEWSHEVDVRSSRLPPSEAQVAMKNPVMQIGQFGADD
nr:hypothetical protein [uncultured Mediterranean phage uvMED]